MPSKLKTSDVISNSALYSKSSHCGANIDQTARSMTKRIYAGLVREHLLIGLNRVETTGITIWGKPRAHNNAPRVPSTTGMYQENKDVVWSIANAKEGDLDTLFWCPGCKCPHRVVTKGPSAWRWNGDRVKPTFEPSILVQGSEFTELGKQQYKEWLETKTQLPVGFKFDSAKTVCHSFVREGKIQFLSDCSHTLAGTTVELAPDW